MSADNDSYDLVDSELKLPELRKEAPVPNGPEPSRRGGLLLGLGMIVLLTVLVYLNMG